EPGRIMDVEAPGLDLEESLLPDLGRRPAQTRLPGIRGGDIGVGDEIDPWIVRPREAVTGEQIRGRHIIAATRRGRRARTIREIVILIKTAELELMAILGIDREFSDR